jgi:hypothetical protein
VGRFIAIFALGTLLAACQNTARPAGNPSPSPSPHTALAAAVLQPAEVPAGLTACPGSGPIAGYLSNLQAADPVLASRMTQGWQQLLARGAVDAAMALFASDPSACTAELGVTAKFKGAASFVAMFADEGQAERPWGGGILGFVPPAPDQVAPGLVRGAGTGLGASSWTYDRPSVRLACWRRSVFGSLLVITNLDAPAFKAATAAIDARLN